MEIRLALFLTAIAVVFYLLLVRPNLTAKQQLVRWAGENRLMILKAERRYLSQGPFTLHQKSGVVFRIEVRTPKGNSRNGWVRFAYDMFRRDKWSSIAVWDDGEPKGG